MPEICFSCAGDRESQQKPGAEITLPLRPRRGAGFGVITGDREEKVVPDREHALTSEGASPQACYPSEGFFAASES